MASLLNLSGGALLNNSGIKLPSGAYAYYPFNGDTLDYSGNGRDIIEKSYATVHSDNVEITNKYGYLKCPFGISNYGIDTTTSITVKISSDFTNFYRKAFFGDCYTWASGTYALIALSASGGFALAFCDYKNDNARFTLVPNVAYNFTLVRTSTHVTIYKDGILEDSEEIKNNAYGSDARNLLIGGMQQNNGSISNYGCGGNIYGFVHYRRVLTEDEIKTVANLL